MKITYFFSLLVITIFLSACADKKIGGDLLDKKHCFRKHTKRLVNSDERLDMTYSPTQRIVNVYPEKYKYSYPVFNPSDKNQIAYVRSNILDDKIGQPELWTFNFCTGKSKRLANFIANAPDWSVKDWLIYRGGGDKLFKIKSNGDSLVTLPKINGAKLTPKWNDKGDLFAIRVNSKRLGAKILVATENGVSVGVFDDFLLNRWDWVDNQITYVTAGEGKQEIMIFNFETRTSHAIETIDNFSTSDSLFLSTTYFKEKEIIFWNQLKQICYTDVMSRKRTIITQGADNRIYNQINVSSDGKTIIANRVDAKKITETKKEERWSLVLIDVETGMERMIKLPE